MPAKVLLLDIETAPVLAHVWGLFKQNVGLNQIKNHPYVLSWAGRWYGEDTIYYDSLIEHKKNYSANPEDDSRVVESAWEMLDEADIVVAHNGKRFDIPWLNGRFLRHGFTPPSPYKIVDTLQVARGRFRLASNRLDYLATTLGVENKHDTDFTLWADCMQGKRKAWREMVNYNIQDVDILYQVYEAMLPWISNHPAVNAYDADETPACRNCGSHHIHYRGTYVANVGEYRRFRCTECGTWGRQRKLVNTQGARDAILSGIPGG